MMDQQWKDCRAIGIFLGLFVENTKEGWTKGTTYKGSEAAVGEGGRAVQGGKVQRFGGNWEFPLIC